MVTIGTILYGILYVLVAWSAIFYHWLVRWKQKRTTSTFPEYMKVNRFSTILSVMSCTGTSITLFATAPPDFNIHTLIGAFTAAYMLDSNLNKDKDNEDNSTKGTFNEQSLKDIDDLFRKSDGL